MGVKSITKVAVSTSATVAALLTAASGATITNLRRLVIDPAGAAVYVNYGAAASASTSLLPANGIDISCTPTGATAIRLYAAAETAVYIWQFD